MPAVLLVAFHFPPDASSTGRLRTLGFARHLPASGWQPHVLTPKPGAYERIDAGGLADIPDPDRVYRSAALDARRHLGWRGRYLSWSALPDRWVSWWPSAVVAGLRLIRRHHVQAIWSTYPIATTHLIAATLARISGLPWIADFRDPVRPQGTRAQCAAARWVERHTLAHATRIVFTTPGAMARYAARFAEPAAAGRLAVIANGYEDSLAPDLAERASHAQSSRKLTLVHSGLLYREGRNPEAFFEALSRLKHSGSIDPCSLDVVLRASGDENAYQTAIDRLDVGDVVRLQPPVAYREALQEQADADGLLLFQGREFNAQIPAKVFEYLRISRPVLALTDEDGDTAGLLRHTGGAMLASMTDAGAIADTIIRFVTALRAGSFPRPDAHVLEGYSRSAGARQLAAMLNDVTE